MQHLFTMVILCIGSALFEMQTMIDCGSTWNLISHLLVSELLLENVGKIPNNLKTIDGTPLMVYGQYTVLMITQDSQGNMDT